MSGARRRLCRAIRRLYDVWSYLENTRVRWIGTGFWDIALAMRYWPATQSISLYGACVCAMKAVEDAVHTATVMGSLRDSASRVVLEAVMEELAPLGTELVSALSELRERGVSLTMNFLTITAETVDPLRLASIRLEAIMDDYMNMRIECWSFTDDNIPIEALSAKYVPTRKRRLRMQATSDPAVLRTIAVTIEEITKFLELCRREAPPRLAALSLRLASLGL